jgi:hypothetical protein
MDSNSEFNLDNITPTKQDFVDINQLTKEFGTVYVFNWEQEAKVLEKEKLKLKEMKRKSKKENPEMLELLKNKLNEIKEKAKEARKKTNFKPKNNFYKFQLGNKWITMH